MVYGYARCSTDETHQDIDRQKRELKKMGVPDEQHMYWEYASGMKADRPELTKLLNVVQPGDTIAATEVSRLTRSTRQLCDIMKEVQDRKLCLMIGSFTADCRSEQIDPMTKGMLMMWGVFSEMERDIISERVKSGMKNAKAKGKKIGRPRTTLANIPDRFWKYYQMYKGGNIGITEISKLMECSRMTVYKYIAIIEKDPEGRNKTNGTVRIRS